MFLWLLQYIFDVQFEGLSLKFVETLNPTKIREEKDVMTANENFFIHSRMMLALGRPCLNLRFKVWKLTATSSTVCWRRAGSPWCPSSSVEMSTCPTTSLRIWSAIRFKSS